MHDEVINLIDEFKKASDKLQHALNYNKENEPYKGFEEYRERVEKFCLGYDDHLSLNRLRGQIHSDGEEDRI